jgi:uncharacterized membrane protein YcaP (DUF421 family)
MNTVLLVLLVYLFVVAGLRILGKRTLGQLSPADLVVLMLIPEFFQQAILRDDFSITNALIAVSTLLILVLMTDTLSYRFPRLGKIVAGDSLTVVSHGVLHTDRMDHERLGAEEILDAMHRAGLEEMNQVKWAVLYPDGTVAIVPWNGQANQQAAMHKHTL